MLPKILDVNDADVFDRPFGLLRLSLSNDPIASEVLVEKVIFAEDFASLGWRVSEIRSDDVMFELPIEARLLART
jgi:hypothetical protein